MQKLPKNVLVRIKETGNNTEEHSSDFTKVSAIFSARLYSDCAIASSSQDNSPCFSLGKAANHLVLVDRSNVVAMNMENGQARQLLLLHRGTQVRLEATEGTDAALTGASCDWPCSEKLQKPGYGRTQSTERLRGSVVQHSCSSSYKLAMSVKLKPSSVHAAARSMEGPAPREGVCVCPRCKWSCAVKLTLLGLALRVSDWSLTTIGSGLVDDRRLSSIEGRFAAAKAASMDNCPPGPLRDISRNSKSEQMALVCTVIWTGRNRSYRMIRTSYANRAASAIVVSHRSRGVSLSGLYELGLMWSTGKDSKWKRKKRKRFPGIWASRRSRS